MRNILLSALMLLSLVASAQTTTPTVLQITVSWTPVPARQGLGGVTYNIYRGPTPGTIALYKQGITAAFYIDKAVSAGTTYCYAVQAQDATGPAAKSGAPCTQAVATGLAATPTGVKVTSP